MRRHAGVACIAREASTTSIAGFAPRGDWTIRLLSVVAASASPRPSVRVRDPDANRPLVTAVAFRGVKSVDINQLRAGLVTKGTACKSPLYLPVCWITRSPIFNTRHHLDALEFRRDVLRIRIFYWQRGWRDAAVVARTERAGAGVRAIFEIEEKEPTVISDLRVVQSDSILPRSAIDRALQLDAGDPLDLIAMDSTVLMLRDELWERGHASANIVLDTTQVSDVSNSGPVSIVIEPGPLVRVSAVQFAGNQKVSDRTIHRLLTFKSGDLFKRSVILGSQRNLYLSGLFSELEIETPPAGDTLRLVRVRVVRRISIGSNWPGPDNSGLRAGRWRLHQVQLPRKRASADPPRHGQQPAGQLAERPGNLLRRY
jgi:outer membrane protein assembly factor BamA